MNPPREDTPVTRPSIPKLRALQQSTSGIAPAGSAHDQSTPKSIEEVVGELMAATVQNTAVIEALAVQIGSLDGKWKAHAEASEERKKEIKDATVKAATHGSNRLALLLGALVTLYEIAAPVLHDLAKWVHQ